MQIVQNFCSYTQPIHVHCFIGYAELVKEWMAKYSNVYFGFTGAVEDFGTDQIAPTISSSEPDYIRNRFSK